MKSCRYYSASRPREYADLLADAMGAGADAETARHYAGGSGPLHRLLSADYEEDEDESEESSARTEEDYGR